MSSFFVDRERRLRDVREPRAGGKLEALGVRDGLDQHDRLRRLAHRPHDLLVTLVADQQHRVAVGRVAPCLHVHLRDEGTGCVDRVQPPRGRVRVHGRRDTVRREDDRLALRHLGLLVDEDRAAGLEVADDVQVVDDLLAHVDRRSVEVERLLDRLDGALDPGAVAARRSEEDLPDHGGMVAGGV